MFQTSTPVVGDGFQNRKSEVAALVQTIQRLGAGEPKWVAILGPRKIGKTSLVLEAARLSKSNTLRIVVLDVQELSVRTVIEGGLQAIIDGMG